MVVSTKSKVQVKAILRYKKVRVSCPICNAQKLLEFPLNCVNTSNPLTLVLILNDKICVHSFIVYLDRDFKVRGTQKIDFIV